MEEEEAMLPSPPFWLQNSQTNRRYLRRSYSLILTSTSLIILLLVTALAFIFIVVPTFHSFTSHFFKPHSVKKTWDSLNLILVLFAIVCAFLSKTNTNNNTETETPRYYQDRSNSFSSNAPFHRFRSFNSYPDLRLDSPWVAADERWRYYDDIHLLCYLKPKPKTEEVEESGAETVAEIVTTVTSEPWKTQPQPPVPQTVPSVELATPPPPQPPPSLSPPLTNPSVVALLLRTAVLTFTEP